MVSKKSNKDLAVVVTTAATEPRGPVAHVRSAFKAAGTGGSRGLSAAADATKSVGAATANAARTAAKTSARTAAATARLVGDLNGDGKIDESDLAIARHAVGRVARVAAKEVGDLGKTVVRHEMTKDAAAGAVVGAVIASAIPLVGTVTGAAVGAAIGVARGAPDLMGSIAGSVAAAVKTPKPRRARTTRRKAT